MERIENEAAIVTGASSGIGAAIVGRLCGLGYEVFGFGRDFEKECRYRTLSSGCV